MAEQFMNQGEEFDNSNMLMKRKIKKRRIIQAPMMGGPTPMGPQGSQDSMMQQ
jgi:hypothetical protein